MITVLEVTFEQPQSPLCGKKWPLYSHSLRSNISQVESSAVRVLVALLNAERKHAAALENVADMPLYSVPSSYLLSTSPESIKLNNVPLIIPNLLLKYESDMMVMDADFSCHSTSRTTEKIPLQQKVQQVHRPKTYPNCRDDQFPQIGTPFQLFPV